MLGRVNLLRPKANAHNLLSFNKYTATYCFYNATINTNISPLQHIHNSVQRIKYPSSISTVVRYYATETPPKVVEEVKLKTEEQVQNEKLSKKDMLKKAVKEYGTTVIVFHVIISLASLGICYVIVSTGLDVQYFFEKVGFSKEVTSKLATQTGTFVAAYAFHKIFAPVRISITLGATPFIVRYLRNIGFLKKPVNIKDSKIN